MLGKSHYLITLPGGLNNGAGLRLFGPSWEHAKTPNFSKWVSPASAQTPNKTTHISTV
jgi:hypothetical protein